MQNLLCLNFKSFWGIADQLLISHGIVWLNIVLKEDLLHVFYLVMHYYDSKLRPVLNKAYMVEQQQIFYS